MAYITAADLRPETAAAFVGQYTIAESVADDTAVTTAIAGFSQRLDDLCNDTFESEAMTLTLFGAGHPKLMLPHRCTAVTTVTTFDHDDVGTVQAASVYDLHSSLYASGAKRHGNYDWLEIVPGSVGLDESITRYGWPKGRRITVAGTFGWTTPPWDIKQAVALMVYNHFTPIGKNLGWATRITTNDQVTEFAVTEPTGIPEVDRVIGEYQRLDHLGVG